MSDKWVGVVLQSWNPNEPRFVVADATEHLSEDRKFVNGKCVENQRLKIVYSVEDIVYVLNNYEKLEKEHKALEEENEQLRNELQQIKEYLQIKIDECKNHKKMKEIVFGVEQAVGYEKALLQFQKGLKRRLNNE